VVVTVLIAALAMAPAAQAAHSTDRFFLVADEENIRGGVKRGPCRGDGR